MNKSIEVEITKSKLNSMDSYAIYQWLEKNKDLNKISIIDDKSIVDKLYSRNDQLINIGLAMYSRSYTYEMYKNTDNQGEKLAYLSSSVQLFGSLNGEIISDLIEQYEEYKFKNIDKLYKIEDRLKAFFSNENIYEFRCILYDLYGRESKPRVKYKNKQNIFRNIDNELWLKLISYTSNQKILFDYDRTIDDTFAPDKCEFYLNMFWRLFRIIEVAEKNAQLLVDIIEKNDAIRKRHSFTATVEDIDMWKNNENNTYFLLARYYLAKTNESLLSSKNKDISIRLAYYSSNKLLNDLNKNLPDETKLKDMYGHKENYDYYLSKFEEFYIQDGEYFLGEIVNNKSLLMDNLLLQHAVFEISSRDILHQVILKDKIRELDTKYPNRFTKYDDLTEIDKLESKKEKQQYLLEKIQDIDNASKLSLKKLDTLSFLPTRIKDNTNLIYILFVTVIVLEIANLFFK